VNESLDDILERAAIGLAQLDAQGRYQQVSAAYCHLLGRGHDELLTLCVQDVTHPDDLAMTLDALTRAAEGDSSSVFEQRCVRGDGSTIRLRNMAVAGRGPAEALSRLVLVAHGIAADERSLDAINPGRADLKLLLDSAADGFCCLDRAGAATLCNAAFLRMFGFKSEADILGRDLYDLILRTHPDGSPAAREDSPFHKVIRSGNHAHISDGVVFRRDGTHFPAEYWVRPIVHDGEIQGAVCTFLDLTERKKLEARQELLSHELSHRVKNTLAMVQAIVSQTLRSVATPREAAQAIQRRLAALTDAHAILIRSPSGRALLADVVEGAVAVHRPDARRMLASGPRLDLSTKAALAITLALHELCTNAAKYGALSNDRGRVIIEWSITGGASDPVFTLLWSERDGPPVAVPEMKGFGSRLIGEAIGRDLRGRTELRFEPEGVRWKLEAPLASLTQ
jgi:PAS domain S-box-containing protein